MTDRRLFPLVLVLSLVGTGAPAAQPASDTWPTVESFTEGFERIDGYVPLYWDEHHGTLWLEVGRLGEELLYVNSLAAGVGSNDIGLDRGQIGDTRIVRFDRVGGKVLLVQPNYDYRAASSNPDERRAVDEAFATSVLWGFEVAARTDDRVLVEVTDFLLRDAHGVGERLSGDYRVEASRSAVYRPRTRGFPRNTEMEAILTFVQVRDGDGPGFGRGALRAVTPTPEAVTVRMHHSLIQLPDDGYTPRRHDPRSGFNALSYIDYATPLGDDLTQRFLRRHRLVKADPTAEVSEPVEPIVYYLDRGTPEPVRSALLDGARWWNEAFEAAGFRDAFRVEMMPPGADSLDVRYNVIQWVHRSTRGWSYGNSVTDPRTGEIIKGHVTLGSLRVRQDYLIAEGLTSPYIDGLDETQAAEALEEMALARIRQLSAHEVGHTIGLGHNYYASELGRVSVMDYPHPLVTLNADGRVDLSEAYDVGIGEWDKVAIEYGYREFATGNDEPEALQRIIDDAWERDLRYLTGQDTTIHPRVHIWANGTDPAAELRRMMRVRRRALDQFGESAIRRGRPLATLEEALVPLYLHHRFQLDATVSALGGVDYLYAVRGDGRVPHRTVPAAAQRAALAALLETIRPSELTIPDDILASIPPRPIGYPRHRELFPRLTGSAFDALSPAIVASTLTVSRVLDAERATRLVTQRARDAAQVGLAEVIETLIRETFEDVPVEGYDGEIARVVQRIVAEQTIRLAGEASLPQVRAVARAALQGLADTLDDGALGPADTAHRASLVVDIRGFLDGSGETGPTSDPLAVPPGSPIGDVALEWLDTLERSDWR